MRALKYVIRAQSCKENQFKQNETFPNVFAVLYHFSLSKSMGNPLREAGGWGVNELNAKDRLT